MLVLICLKVMRSETSLKIAQVSFIKKTQNKQNHLKRQNFTVWQTGGPPSRQGTFN